MGRELVEQREDFPMPAGSSLPKEFYKHNQGNLQKVVQSIRSYLPYPLLAYYVAQC